MAITSAGIGSGLDVEGIVTKLMRAESQPLTDFAKKEAAFQSQLTAYGTFKGALSTFQGSLSTLNTLSTYQTVSASSSDTTILTTSAASTSSAGSYSLNITSLAQAHSLIAPGQVSSTGSLGNATDTLSFQFGTSGSAASFGSAKTVSIAANSSLQNIADSVNSANIGVSATIINDGSSAPYRLVFTSNSTGAANSMSVTATDTALKAIVNFDQVGATGHSMSQTAAGVDAALTVNGIAISSASNTVTGAVNGVTLQLVKAGTASVTVYRDTSKILPAVQSFVKSYNELAKNIKDLTGYDAATKTGGSLQGDATVLTIQSQLRRTLTSALSVPSGSLSTLSQVGISFNKDGTLSLDSTKLQSAISNNVNDVTGLFAAAGQVTDSLISFDSSADSTTIGSRAITVSTIATTGNAIGNINVNSGSTTIASGTAINVTLDGNTASVSLPSGGFTASQLATMLQTAINGNSTFSSNSSSVTVTVDPSTGFLKIASNRYGSASVVNLSDGTGTTVATYMGVMTNATGVDTAGTIGGVAATGSGQFLTSPDGLKIKVNGGATGTRGSVSYTKGVAFQINNLLTGYLGDKSVISSRSDGLNSSIKSVQDQSDKFSARLVGIEARYRKEFTNLDTLMSQLQQTQSFLTQQLASITKSTA